MKRQAILKVNFEKFENHAKSKKKFIEKGLFLFSIFLLFIYLSFLLSFNLKFEFFLYNFFDLILLFFNFRPFRIFQ